MADIAMGKLLPNLKVTLGNDSDRELMEDGELSDSGDTLETPPTNENPEKNVNIVRSWMNTLQNPKVYENKSGGFVTGLDLSSEVLMKKLDERAERFGLEKKEVKQVTQKEIDTLYKSLDIDLEEMSSGKPRFHRLDAVHMRGVEEMSTSDIFKYFGDYGPSSVEWINDFSCNVVWLDEATTARALLGMSEPMSTDKKSEESITGALNKEDQKSIEDDGSSSDENENSKEASIDLTETKMDVDDKNPLEALKKKERNFEVPVPPGNWRVGASHPKSKALLLRFATRDDKKIRGAEKRSQYYQKYGNPNYGGMKGIISGSKKRKLQAAKNKEMIGKISDPTNDSEKDYSELLSMEMLERPTREKKPRMKMYADEEEEKSHSTKYNDSRPLGGIHSRLGKKYTRDDLHTLGRRFSSESEEDEDEDDNVAINCTVPSRYKIWTDIAKEMAKESDPFKPKRRDSDRESSPTRYRPSSMSKKSVQRPSSFRRTGDLRNVLNGSKNIKRDRNDLRSKINRMKSEETNSRKHRSPLCVDD